MTKYKKSVDWVLMRHDWMAGIKSVLQLSAEHKVSRAAILKHWKKEGVERNLADKIKAKADSLVTCSLVTPKVTPQTTSKSTVTEMEVIKANAIQQSTIILNERKDVSRARTLAMSLLDELEAQITYKDLFRKLGEILSNPDAEGNTTKINDIYHKVLSFNGRTDSMKKLAETLKTLIELERKVYKIDEVMGEGSVEDFIRRARGIA